MSLLKSWSDHRTLREARRRADEQLLASRLASPRLAWRIAELTAPKHRDELARALADIVHAADERFLPGAKPLDRSAIREARAQLLELASWLFDSDRSVTPRAVLLVARLLDDSGSPLYDTRARPGLIVQLGEIRKALGS